MIVDIINIFYSFLKKSDLYSRLSLIKLCDYYNFKRVTALDYLSSYLNKTALPSDYAFMSLVFTKESHSIRIL
jgi:hypothetical protein